MPAEVRPIRVVLADDECLFRTSLRQLLDAPADVIREVYGTDVGPGFEVVGEAASGEETVRVVGSVRPDLLLLDLHMPRLSGLEAFREMAQAPPVPRTILLTGEMTGSHLLSAVRCGIDGLVVKQAATERLFEAIAAVTAGRFWLDRTLVSELMDATRRLLEVNAVDEQVPVRLTDRERSVLTLVVAGYGNKDIAEKYGLSQETVKHHMTRLFDKIGASNRVELARRAVAAGFQASVQLNQC